MPLDAGTKLGAYEIVALIGAGGMGEVYRARDTRLKREVAIKVLPDAFANDAERLARFQREAELLATLNHPNIGAVYGFEQSATSSAIVLELIEGETLADRLQKNPALPRHVALSYAVQMAEALDLAHRHGIVHRDLKPANVMVTRSGIKLLDFGLAKSALSVASPTQVSSLPTTTPVTAEGAILGTLQYMAPEQIEGRDVDARSDIFAFGSLLYEMLAGRRPFEGASQAGIIAAILEKDPPSLSVTIPAALEHIVMTCLAKHREDRWQSARDLARELRWIAKESQEAKVPIAKSTRAKVYLPAALAMVLAGAMFVAAEAVRSARRIEHPGATIAVFPILPPPGIELGTERVGRFAVSPNGKYVAFVGYSGGMSNIWVRRLDLLRPELVPGTAGADFDPFWSPDNEEIGFYAGEQLKKVRLDGGGAVTLCRLTRTNYAGGTILRVRGTWNRNGVILFAPSTSERIHRVAAAGGSCEPVTQFDSVRGDIGHLAPHFLPDGDRFLFSVRNAKPELDGTFIASLSGAPARLLMQGTNNVAYVAPGYVLFVRGRELLAQRCDPATLELLGTPTRIADYSEFTVPFEAGSNFSVSENGVLVYGQGGRGDSQLTWFDRMGRRLGTVGPARSYGNLELFSDDTRLAVSIADPTTTARNIWTIDLARDVATKVTFGPARDNSPVWSPDGHTIAFTRQDSGTNSIVLLSLADGKETRIWGPARLGAGGQLDDWSPDGRVITFNASPELKTITATGGEPTTFVTTTSAGLDESHFSPDGKWIAYNSNESGTWQVYVAPFGEQGQRMQVSQDGGAQARWRADGKELYFLTLDGRMMSVDMLLSNGRVRAGIPNELFKTDLGVNARQDQYAVTRDGQRFLLENPTVEGERYPLTAVINWMQLVDK